MSPGVPYARARGRIRVRVTLLIALGMLAPTLVMAWAGWRSYREVERRVLAERALLARLVAERLDAMLSADMEALQGALPAPELRLDEAGLEEERAALRRIWVRRHQLFDEVFLLDRDGKVLVDEPAELDPADASALLSEALRAGGPGYTDLIAGANGAKRLFALVPLRRRPGEVIGVVGARIHLGAPRLASALASPQLGEGESVDVVDGHAMVIASTDPARVFTPGDQADVVEGLLHQNVPAAPNCSAWEGEAAGGRREVYALCPLKIVHWGVKVQQPQGAAFAFIESLTRNVAALAAALFGVALLFAWGASLSVTRPVDTLTRAAQRIAQGSLSEPIPPLPADEVGRLGASLEKMRVALKESLERVERANEELEARVRERTAELERLNRALRDRDEQRRLALRKVISAQEDERKRIARELHDETSQSLAALVMSLQVSARGLPDDARKRVEDARALAVRTLEEVHRLIVDLRPSVLDDLGLKSAIQWYADRTLKTRGVSVRCEFSGLDEGRLPFEVETAVFRCAQEAMTNIARHANADGVLVQCSMRGARLTMEIEDDGDGFDVAALSAPDERGRGFGLMGIRERVELLGGTVRIESSPGEGTLVALDVPAGMEAAA